MTDYPSRVDRIKRYLDEHRAEIEAAPAGSTTIDYAGGEISYKVTRLDRGRNGTERPQTAVMD